MPDLNEISPNQLMRLIGTPEAPVILDVRIDEDVAAIPSRVPCAIHLPHTEVATFPAKTTQSYVVVCHGGLKLSHGAAAILRAQGYKAEVLTGGMLAWVDADLPATPIAMLDNTALWVTRHRPKIDRIACPWLIRRFINPDAQILYVPPRDVLGVASKFDAIAFDATDAPYTHVDGQSTFDALLTAFALRLPALGAMATVIRAADLGQQGQSPEAAGLHALSVGLSRMYRDDVAQLEAGLPLYDALYRWARDGQSEQHGDTL